jgi:hypothetical protein
MPIIALERGVMITVRLVIDEMSCFWMRTTEDTLNLS